MHSFAKTLLNLIAPARDSLICLNLQQASNRRVQNTERNPIKIDIKSISDNSCQWASVVLAQPDVPDVVRRVPLKCVQRAPESPDMKYDLAIGAVLTALAVQVLPVYPVTFKVVVNTLIVSCPFSPFPKFVIATDDIEFLIQSCNDSVQGMTEDHKARYRANEYPDDPVTHCFVRCLGMTLNLYDDAQGADLHANWEHLGKVEDEEAFVAKHRACLDGRNLEKIEDPCDRAYGAFQCLKEDYGMDRVANEADRK